MHNAQCKMHNRRVLGVGCWVPGSGRDRLSIGPYPKSLMPTIREQIPPPLGEVSPKVTEGVYPLLAACSLQLAAKIGPANALMRSYRAGG